MKHFITRNRERLSDNPRMAMPYPTLDRMDDDRKKQIVRESEAFLDSL